MLALLTATVLSVGGPLGAQPSKPQIFGNATVRVFDTQHKTVALSTVGNLAIRLRPGIYGVEALLEPPVLNEARTCGVRYVFVGRHRRHHHNQTVALTCQIK